jgi:hypothetical protein
MSNVMFAAVLSIFPKVAIDPRAAVNAIAGPVERPDLSQQTFVLDCPPRLRGLKPCIKSAPVYP